MEKTLKPWGTDYGTCIGDKEIEWKDIVGFKLVKLAVPWIDEEGDEFWYTMNVWTEHRVYMCNHYIDDDANTRADIALYFEHLAKLWKGEIN